MFLSPLLGLQCMMLIILRHVLSHKSPKIESPFQDPLAPPPFEYKKFCCYTKYIVEEAGKPTDLQSRERERETK